MPDVGWHANIYRCYRCGACFLRKGGVSPATVISREEAVAVSLQGGCLCWSFCDTCMQENDNRLLQALAVGQAGGEDD
jgi:hypothetical protein